MGNFFRRLGDWFRRFMYGRYGMDGLSKFMIFMIIPLIILSYIFRYANLGIAVRICNVIMWVLLILSYARMFSRKTYKRALENQKFYQKTAGIRRWFNNQKTRFSQRKTHKFFNCPNCKQTIRVPKGKGKIEITCPKCKTKFVKKS